MKVLAVENFAGTHLGLVRRALEEAGTEIDTLRMHAGDALPAGHADHDALVVLGGEQSATDDDKHPYLPALAQLTKEFGAADKAVLGICLGAQIVARGFGGRNVLGLPVEFGWKRVVPTAIGRADPVISVLGEGAPLFHWHCDTFDLPACAEHLAASEQTPHQGFRVGRAVYGIQFHFEADTGLVDDWTSRYRTMLDRDAPRFLERKDELAATLGAEADRVGLDLARAWVRLI